MISTQVSKLSSQTKIAKCQIRRIEPLRYFLLWESSSHVQLTAITPTGSKSKNHKKVFLVSTTADVQKTTSTSATSFDDVQSRHLAGDGMAQIVSGLFLLKFIRIICFCGFFQWAKPSLAYTNRLFNPKLRATQSQQNKVNKPRCLADITALPQFSRLSGSAWGL